MNLEGCIWKKTVQHKTRMRNGGGKLGNETTGTDNEKKTVSSGERFAKRTVQKGVKTTLTDKGRSCKLVMEERVE